MFSLVIAFAILLSGCKLSFTPATQTQPEASYPALGSTEAAPTQVQAADPAPLPAAKETAAPTPTLPPTPTPTLEPFPLGPASYPPGVNPLTGLAVSDPEKLKLPPALVSITNFPVNARPPAGLSFTPFVFEMYIGEGATRFLALFYGEFPTQGEEGVGDDPARLPIDTIGPVRSGRLPYEPLRKQYNGFLVMASAASNVAAKLSAVSNIFGSDSGDINSAMIDATKLEQIARSQQKNLDPASLSGLLFDQLPPQGGLPAKMIWIPYSYKNQIIWRFNAESGGYDRYQDQADGKTFIQATDRINSSPLNYENVVIL
ncbi:MAG: DUF3048 domain-containing protein, partial [Anaerolineaceae bacterium]|nr:DUF3048 domain-containing protein [Anaerolineaceae bacterium]